MYSVEVLMSTYNGERYIREQIESLLAQENVKVSILVRDDGSTDSTQDILDDYQKKGLLKWYCGENLKPARSFLDLVQHAAVNQYYAFCDQDDVWKPYKLKRAIQAVDGIGNMEKPILYCANYQLTDSELRCLPDNGHVSTDTFKAALVSSCCTGCTVVFNESLLKMLKKEIPNEIVMHDDWAHKVCLALGGKVIYDDEKVLFYRQHGKNADGGIHTKRGKIKQICKRIHSKECIRSKQLMELFRIYSDMMDSESFELLKQVAFYKKMSFMNRCRLAFSKDISTPYKKLNKGFSVSILLGYF